MLTLKSVLVNFPIGILPVFLMLVLSLAYSYHAASDFRSDHFHKGPMGLTRMRIRIGVGIRKVVW